MKGNTRNDNSTITHHSDTEGIINNANTIQDITEHENSTTDN